MKAIKLFCSILFLILTFTFISCEREEESIVPEITVNDGQMNYFENTMNFSASSEQQILRFTTNTNWTLSVSSTQNGESWCTLSQTSGSAGDHAIIVKVSANEGLEDRNVVLSLVVGSVTKTVVVSQKHKEAITLTKNRFEVGPEGGKIEVEIKSNVDYEVEIPVQYQDWISQGVKSRGLSINTLSFNIAESEEYDKREGEIRIKSKNLTETIEVYQTGSSILVLSQNEFNVGSDGGVITIEISSNFNYEIDMPNVSWIKSANSSRAMSSHTLRFEVSPNDTYEGREASIIFKDAKSSKKESVTIKQKQNDAIVLSMNKYEVGAEGGIINIEVKSNVNYEVIIPEQYKKWISQISNTRALSSTILSFNIAESKEYDKREGEIIFKSEMFTESVNVYQTGSAVLVLSQNEYNVSSDGGIISVEISTNFEFEIDMPDVSWIHSANDSRAISNHTLRYKIDENTTYDSRSAKIVFYNKNHSLKETLTIIQSQKDAIVLSKQEYEVVSEGETIEVLLDSNVDFEISIEDDWIMQVDNGSSRAMTEYKLYFQIAENELEEERSGRIDITDKNKQITETIYIEQEGKEVDIPYLTFTADAKQTLAMSKAVETLEYSVNGGEWETLGTTTVTFGGTNGDLRLRGKNSNGTATDTFSYSIIRFGNETPVVCTGDIRTLIDYENYTTVNTSDARFCYLFKDCYQLTSAPALPATTLVDHCYYRMFNGCTSLSEAPELPAKTLADFCYYYMFEDCTSLTSAPTLPATTLADWCYRSMFYGCTSLTSAPVLPAKTLAEGCYYCMFHSCTSLTSAPTLPATTLADWCYYCMFYGCTSLTTAPVLPATTLADACYSGMFCGCTSLTSAPALPATTLAEGCYSSMFYDCTSLTAAPELPVTTLAESCYSWMFYGCTSLTEAPTLPATTLADRCYYCMFYGCTKLNRVTMLATNISADNCLTDWLYGVSPTGTFTKSYSMTSLPNGSSGIPNGWTVKNEGKDPYGTIGGYGYVDLGLPSGKLWATTNFGASSETGSGSYYMWSSTDRVSSSWGNKWHTPTQAEYDELLRYCSHTWTTRNGVNGYLFTGKNGAQMFLPAAGFKVYMEGYGYSDVQSGGNGVYYWSITKSSYTWEGQGFAFMLQGSSNSISADQTYNITRIAAPIRPISR